MSWPLRIVSLVSLLVAALALVACGGADEREQKNAYARELNAAQEEFAANADSVADQRVPEETDAKIRFVQRFEVTIDQVVAKLRGIEVPGEVRAEHQQLVDVMAGFGADVQKLTQTYRGGDARKVSTAIVAFKATQTQVDTRINATIDAINSKLAAT